ncbi:hypothetical protein ACE0DR_24795 [Azotobacter sp. CWF10]
MSTQDISRLAQGNIAVRNKDYVTAIEHYICALDFPELTKIIADNIKITQHKYRSQRATASSWHVAVLGPSSGGAPKNRSEAITILYRIFADTRTLDTTQLTRSNDIQSFLSDDVTSQITDFVVRSPFDIVHLTEPCPRQLLVGMLYKLIWDAKVLIDLGDEALETASKALPSLTDAFLQERDLPSFTTSLRNGSQSLWSLYENWMESRYPAQRLSTVSVVFSSTLIQPWRMRQNYNPASRAVFPDHS